MALLALIVASWPQPLSRDRAMALLWPERDQAGARRLLNLAVHVLRSALGECAIASNGDGLLFDPSQAICDLHELRAAVADADPERIVRAWAGTLLDGFHLPESSEFGYWLDERRAELSHAYTDALLALAERQEQAGDMSGRVGTCRRLAALDPHSAVHARTLMLALDAAGDRAGAIRHAAEHARRLRADLDLPPDPEVAALAEHLRAAPPAPTRERTARAPARPAVAVLPFLTLGGDPDDEDFSDGVTEDVIAHLARIHALDVIARASVMPFKARRQDLREIGVRLGATTVLDGSVRHAGGRVRIVATLVDVRSGRQLWSETYDREMTDIFAIQTDVALHIAAALEAELTSDERLRVERVPTVDVQAWRLFLQGRRLVSEYRLDGLACGAEFFTRALSRDPSFALAAANLAMACAELAEQGALPADVAYARATAAAARALELDPELAEAHCTIGYLKTVYEFDWEGAERAFQRALELSPGDADAHDLYGRLCAGMGRFDEALALQRRAQELDPLAHRLDVTSTLIRAGRYEEALQGAGAAVELDPSHERARATLGWALFLSGRREEGIAELERAAASSPNSTLWLGQLGQAYGRAGREEKAREILRTLEGRAADGFVSPYHFAYVYTGLGETDRAIDCLERAVADRTGAVYGIKGSFLFTALHDHPRFQALLRRMNLRAHQEAV
jgi:serine/threonine-protein kinase